MLIGAASPAEADDLKFTPPGQVLLAACAEVRSSTAGAQAMLQRATCLRFIEATLMFNRLLTFGYTQETQPRFLIPPNPGWKDFPLKSTGEVSLFSNLSHHRDVERVKGARSAAQRTLDAAR